MKNDEALKTLLRKSGHKATASRLAILALFKNNKKPLSAQEIIDSLPTGAGIDQATVYRTIRSLKGKGVLRQIDLRHNHAHFELADIDDHHHIICMRCGKIEDVEHHNIEAMERGIIQNAKHFAEIKQHTLEFYGICKSCAKKRGAETIPLHKDAPL